MRDKVMTMRAAATGYGTEVGLLLPGPVVRVRLVGQPERAPGIADCGLLWSGQALLPLLWSEGGEVFVGPGLYTASPHSGGYRQAAARAIGGVELRAGKVVGLSDAVAHWQARGSAAQLRALGGMLEAAGAIIPTAWVRCRSSLGVFSGSWAEFRPDWIDEVAWMCDGCPATWA